MDMSAILTEVEITTHNITYTLNLNCNGGQNSRLQYVLAGIFVFFLAVPFSWSYWFTSWWKWERICLHFRGSL